MFKEGDKVISLEYFNKECFIKKISNNKCSIVFNEPVKGSCVKITSLDKLILASHSSLNN